MFETMSKEWTSKEEVAATISTLIDAMKKIKSDVDEILTFSHNKSKKDIDALKSLVSELESKVKGFPALLEKTQLGALQSFKKEITAKISEVEGKIAYFDPSYLEKRLETLEKEPEETPVKLRDKLQSLKDDERLDKSAVKGLDDIVDRVKRLESMPGVARGVRRIFQPRSDDFSDSTDGATKTFELSTAPLSEVIFVYCTDFPVHLRPTIDFTVSGRTLTLDDAIPAPSEGSTLLIQYYA